MMLILTFTTAVYVKYCRQYLIVCEGQNNKEVKTTGDGTRIKKRWRNDYIISSTLLRGCDSLRCKFSSKRFYFPSIYVHMRVWSPVTYVYMALLYFILSLIYNFFPTHIIMAVIKLHGPFIGSKKLHALWYSFAAFLYMYFALYLCISQEIFLIFFFFKYQWYLWPQTGLFSFVISVCCLRR